MSCAVMKCEQSRARVFGEVVGRVRGLDECASDEQIRLRFVPLDDDDGQFVRADRTGFFWKRRLRQGAYKLSCSIQLNGKMNAVDVGVVHCHGGVNEMDVDLSGSAVMGRVQRAARPASWATELVLASQGEDGVRHRALLDSHGQFMFTGVNPGRFVLTGEIRGFGDIKLEDILVSSSERRDVGILGIQRRPYLRFNLRTDTGKPFRGVATITMWCQARVGQTWGWEGRLRDVDGGTITVRNTFHGAYRYRVETRWYRTAEGRIRLTGNDVDVPVMCRRQREVTGWRRGLLVPE